MEHEFPSNTKYGFPSMKIRDKGTLKKSHFEPTSLDFTWGAALAIGGNDANFSNTSLCYDMNIKKNGCVYSNNIVYKGNNNANGNILGVDKKVEKSEKFLVLNLDIPFDVYGFRS